MLIVYQRNGKKAGVPRGENMDKSGWDEFRKKTDPRFSDRRTVAWTLTFSLSEVESDVT